MTTSDVDALILRLGSLERSCLRWRAFGACLAVVLAILGIAGAVAPPAKLLTLQTLRIVDERGKERIVLDGTGGQADLSLYGDDEADRIGLAVGIGGAAMFTFNDPVTKEDRLLMGLTKSGDPLLIMKDSEGVTRLGAGVYPKGGPGIRLLDASKKVIARMP
jgi:hypothetical protein